MPKIYPAKHDVFLTADSIRQESGGKVTVVGMFSAAQILLPEGAKFPAAFPLAFFMGFWGEGEGSFLAKLKLTDPMNNALGPELAIGTVIKKPSQPMQLIVNFPLFTAPKPGDYNVSIFLDNNAYSDVLHVRVAPVQTPSTPVV